MKFLCLGYHDEKHLAAMSASERDEFLRECLAFDETLRKSGRVLSGESLHSAASAKTLRFQGGELTVTDGPFAETKEQLGGFMVLEADDVNHAVRLMSEVPCGRLGGGLEIRPINAEFPNSNSCAQS
jgi:hypothetical protein